MLIHSVHCGWGTGCDNVSATADMDPRTRERRLGLSRRICRREGLPLTQQRRAVLEAVLDLDHPTADAVHTAVSRRNAGVSRATVYRALWSLARIDVISRASHPGKGVRYDGRTETHHHLVCLRCDTVVDFADERLDTLPVPDASRLGFRIRDIRVLLRGLCHSCREREDQP